MTSGNPSNPNSLAKPLREASVIIFLALTLLQAAQTVYLARLELAGMF